MKITIKVFADLREIIGESEQKIDINLENTVYDALNSLIDSYPKLKEKIFDKDGKLSRYINVFVNGRNVRTGEGLRTTLEENDRVALFPPFGGG